MNHEVYICYDEKDKEYCDAVYNILEKNDIKSWVKSKEMGEDDPVDKITHAIADSKCFLLILSKNSKDTNYVITETDIAFSREVPIIVFNIDGTETKGNLEFILENQPRINSFPKTKGQLETLVKKTSDIVKKPVSKVKIDSEYVRLFEKMDPGKKGELIKKGIMIAIPIAIILILIYLFVIVPTGQHTTDDGIFTMNVTDVDVSGSSGNHKYTVYGKSYNMPSDSKRYFMNIKFYDNADRTVFEVNSTADEFKSGIIWSGDIREDNITHLGFKLTDINNNVLSKQNYTIS